MASRLEILITARNTASIQVQKTAADVVNLNTAIVGNTAVAKTNTIATQKMGASMATAGAAATKLRTTMAALGGLVLFTSAIRSIVQYEQAMSNVKAVMLTVGFSAKEVEQQFAALSAEARRLGATTVFSAVEAANGLEFLGRAGFTAREAVSALEGTLNLAAAGGLGLGLAADIASNVLSGFNINAKEAGRVADVLALTAASANTSVEQLGDALKFVAPISASLGVSLEATSAAIGKLSDAGLQASLAGTGLRKVLLKLSSPSTVLSKVLAKLGLEFEDVNTQTNDLSDVLALLRTRGLGTADAIKLFGDRGAPAALALGNVTDELEKLNKELSQAEGHAKVMAGVMSDNLAGAFKALTSAITETVLQAGDEGLAGSLRNIIDVIAGLVRTLNGTQDPLGKNAVLFRKVADAAETLFDTLKILIALRIGGFFVSAITSIAAFGTSMAAASGGVAALTVSMRGLGLALGAALGPIGLIITLGATLVSFATSDAPQAISALEETARATNRLTEAFKDADSGAIRTQLIRANSEANALGDTLDELDAKIDEATTITSGNLGSYANEQALEALRREVRTTEARFEVVQQRIATLSKLEADANVREAEAAVESQKKLEKLQAQADQAELTAVSAKLQAEEILRKQALGQRAALAKTFAAAELSAITARFQAEKALLEAQQEKEFDDGQLQEAQVTNEALLVLDAEYYAEKRRLQEEQVKFDLQILEEQRAIIVKAAEDQRDEINDIADLNIGSSDNSDERAALETQRQAQLEDIRTNNLVKLQTIKDGEEKIHASTRAANAKLTQEGEKALLDRAAKFAELQSRSIEQAETTQKAVFQDRIDAIIAQAAREALAAQANVDTGAESNFGLGDRLETIDQEAVDKLNQVKLDMIAFNEAAQDPITPEAFLALGDTIEEFGKRANVQLERIKTGLATGLGDAMFEIVDGTKSAKEAFEDFARTFLRDIAKMILQQIALNAVRSAFGGFSGGGAVGAAGGGYIGAAEGGYITGKGTSTSDSIPARLSNGEYVVQAKAVQGYGLNFMEAINRMKLPTQKGLPKFAISRPRRMKFAEGGVVNSGASKGEGATTSLRIVNVTDVNQASDYLQTADGESMIINIIRRNGSSVKQLLG